MDMRFGSPPSCVVATGPSQKNADLPFVGVKGQHQNPLLSVEILLLFCPCLSLGTMLGKKDFHNQKSVF